MAYKKVDAFEGMNRYQRYAARKRGINVPKLSPGMKPKPFMSFVRKTKGCWVWEGVRNRDGYGTYCNKGTHMAHRYSWKMHGRDLTKDIVLRHTCDNPACVNPDHLIPGSHRDNQMDKVMKGRQAKGERVGTSRLTEAQVIFLRNRYKQKNKFGKCTYAILAKEFSVSKDTIRKAIRGINWGHLA